MLSNSKGFALVTGAGRGLGLEVVKKILATGKPVLATVRDVNAGVQLKRDLASSKGGLEVLQLDTASTKSIEELKDKISREYDQKIDVLVNNAGILLNTWTEEDLDRTLAVNFTGPLGLVRALQPHLAEGALVINVSSGLGKLSSQAPEYRELITKANSLEDLRSSISFNPGSKQSEVYAPVYSLSKAMLNRATQLLARDPQLAARRISVVSVCPGWCSTDMGGATANRTPAQGADSIVWWVHNYQPQLNGLFYRDGQPFEF